MSRKALPRPKCSVVRSASEIPSRASSDCIWPISGSPGANALEVGLTEQDARRVGERSRGLLHRLHRLGLAAELHEERAPVGDGVHLRRAGQGGGAIVGRKRRLELAHRLTDLADRIVRLGAFGRGEGSALRRVERLVKPVELL